MPRPYGYGGEHEGHGTTIKSLPHRPRRSRREPDDTTIPPVKRKRLRDAPLLLSQLSQKNRRGRERTSTDPTSDNQVRVSGSQLAPK